MKLLLVYPNNRIYDRKAASAARSVASPGTEILASNPADGPVSIEGYYDEVFSIPGLLEEIRRALAGCRGRSSRALTILVLMQHVVRLLVQ